MAHEEWRDVVGFEGYYQVSNLGRVKGLDRIVPDKQLGHKHIRGRMMTNTTSGGRGYPTVTLTKNGSQRPYYVHRLVAEAFIPNPDNLPEIDHIDAVITNNDISNLRWVTHEENVKHIREMGHWYNGSENLVRYREEALLKSRKPVIRSDGKVFKSVVDAAAAIGVSRQSVSRVLKDETGRYQCQGYRFKYA